MLVFIIFQIKPLCECL